MSSLCSSGQMLYLISGAPSAATPLDKGSTLILHCLSKLDLKLKVCGDRR